MHISVSITLAEGDSFDQDTDKVATAILKAVGGDPEKDLCMLQVLPVPNTTTVGTPPPPPESAEVLEGGPEA